MSQTFKLYRLQQIDSQIDRAAARQREIEAALNEDLELRQAHQTASEINAQLEELRKALRRAEENVQGQRIKIEQTDAALYGGKVRNPKELQDLQNESASLKKYLSVLEDRQLEAMIAVEESETEYQDASTHLEGVRVRLAGQHRDLHAEHERLLGEISRLQSERQATLGSIPPEDINLYEALRLQRRGIAVAKVTNQACAACGSTLSAARLNSARSPNQITRCDTCGRILYGG